jgi:hypothetical protein
MYEELYSIIGEWEKQNTRRALFRRNGDDLSLFQYIAAQPVHATGLREQIIDHVVKTIKAGYPQKGRSHELRFGVEHRGLTKRWRSGADLAVKKLISLSTTSFVHYGKIHEDGEHGWQQYWNEIVPFLEFLVRFEPLVRENLVIPTATHSSYYNIGDFSGDPDDRREEGTGKEVLHLNFDLEEIEKQFFELRDPNFKPPPGAVEIFLPHLKHVDMQAIVRLRKDERDAFIRYHQYLSNFFRDSAAVNDEGSIVDLLQKIDEGVRKTEATLNRVTKKETYSGSGVAVGLLSMGLGLFMPPDIAEYIRAVVGGATASAGLQYLSSRHASLAEVKDADFYFPWRLHHLNKSKEWT